MPGIRYIQAILFLLGHLTQIAFGIVVVPQRRCPSDQKDWEDKSNRTNCYGDGVYHCMQDQGGRYVSFCAASLWIQPDYCPEFQTNFSMIGVTLCPGALNGCPEKPFMSNEIYNYPSCFRTVIRSTAPANDKQNTTPWLSILLGIIVSIIAIMCLVLLLRRRRNLRKNELNRRYLRETEDGTGFLMEMENNTTTNPNEDTEVKTVIDQTNVSEEDLRKDVELNEKFVKPRTYCKTVNKVKKQGYVVIYGVIGSGKSTLARYIVSNEFPEHRVLHMRGKQKQVPKIPNDGGLVFWDDCFGIWNISDIENKEYILKNMKKIIDKCIRDPQTCKAVLCFDSFFFDENEFHDYIANTIDLNDNYHSQFLKERFSDEMTYTCTKKFKIRNVSGEVGFPLLISLILEDPYLEENKDEFLKNPTLVLQNRFHNLLKDQPAVYVTLIYAVCNYPVNLKEVSKEKWDILKKECKKTGSCESEKEQNNGAQERDIYLHAPKKIANSKGNSEISEEANIQIPTTDDHSEKSKELENITPHKETMGGAYKITNEVNEGTDDCVRDGKHANGNFTHNYDEKKRDKVKDGDNNLGSEDRPNNKFNVTGIKILKRRKVIEMNATLAKYLVKNESQEAQFEFRHQFLAESLLRFHVEHFGKIGLSKAANEEVAFVLRKI